VKRLLQRLPLIVLAVLGVWWWQNSGGPRARSLSWELAPDEQQALSSVEIELWSNGQLYRRERRFFPADHPAPQILTQQGDLPPGDYQARLRFHKADGGTHLRETPFKLSGEDALTLRPHTGR